MRILVVDQYGECGGAQHCLIDAVQGFRSRGWETDALVPRGPLLDRLEAFCETVQPLKSGQLSCGRKTVRDVLSFGRDLASQYLSIRRVVLHRQIDVLYVNGPRLMPAAALAHECSSVVFHAHSVIAQEAASKLLRTAVRVSRAHVIASSRFVAAALGSASPRPLTVVRNGVPPSRRRPRAPGRRFTAGMLSRIAAEKGALEFTLAARLVRQAIPQSRFILGGKVLFGGDRVYADKVRSECEHGSVEMPGWIDDTARFLGSLDVLVVPSSAEDATPRVVLEAFSAGVPVIACAAGGLPEIVRDGEDGVLVRPGDIIELATQLQALATAPDRVRRLGDNAYRRWLSDFTVDRYQEEVCEAVGAAAAFRRHHRTPLKRAGARANA